MPRIGFLVPLALLAVGLLVAAVVAPRLRPVTFHGTDLGHETVAPDFTLRSDAGPVSLSELRRDATLLFFGYTSCPDVCPLTMSKLRRVVERIGEDASRVRVVLVSVDPELDSPERVAEYARRFHPDFVGLTGTRAGIMAVGADYGAYVGEPEPPAAAGAAGHEGHGDHDPSPRIVPHTSHVFGIDRDGTMRLLWGGEATAEEIGADVRELLRR